MHFTDTGMPMVHCRTTVGQTGALDGFIQCYGGAGRSAHDRHRTCLPLEKGMRSRNTARRPATLQTPLVVAIGRQRRRKDRMKPPSDPPQMRYNSPPCMAADIAPDYFDPLAVDPQQARDVARWRKAERVWLLPRERPPTQSVQGPIMGSKHLLPFHRTVRNGRALDQYSFSNVPKPAS